MSDALQDIKTITQDGVTTEYALSCESGPVVIFLNGYRMPLASWCKLYPEIQKHGNIFAYNRPGVGQTSKALRPQTGEEIIRSLDNVLKALNLSPPFILVAHSYGGIFANLYARSKPENVSAIVFVESTHPDEIEKQREFKPPWLVRAMNNALKAIERRFDKHRYSEDECIAETMRQIKAAGDFPSIPVAVVTGDKKMPSVPEAAFSIHLQYQKELAALSPYSIQIIADKSDHFPQITDPELVIQAVREIVNKVTMANMAFERDAPQAARPST